MNIKNNILIHSLEQGYVITDYISGKKYAVESPEGVICIISKALGIPEPELESEGSKHQKEEMDGIEQLSPAPNILKQDILIQKFEYDHSLRKSISDYKNTWYAEFPDGKVVIGYGETSYYTTKEKVMQIRYPIQQGYFKESGISTTAQTCLRAYRNLLSADKSLTKNDDDEIDWKDESGSIAFREHEKKIKEQGDEQPVSDYVSKSTQDRIREDAEQKAEHRRKKDNCKGQTKMSEKTRKLRDMTIKMGIR